MQGKKYILQSVETFLGLLILYKSYEKISNIHKSTELNTESIRTRHQASIIINILRFLYYLLSSSPTFLWNMNSRHYINIISYHIISYHCTIIFWGHTIPELAIRSPWTSAYCTTHAIHSFFYFTLFFFWVFCKLLKMSLSFLGNDLEVRPLSFPFLFF